METTSIVLWVIVIVFGLFVTYLYKAENILNFLKKRSKKIYEFNCRQFRYFLRILEFYKGKVDPNFEIAKEIRYLEDEIHRYLSDRTLSRDFYGRMKKTIKYLKAQYGHHNLTPHEEDGNDIPRSASSDQERN